MIVHELSLEGFRNYETFHARFSPSLNVIQGENAQGKTNLLEAISALSGMRSQRARSDAELLGFSRQDAHIWGRMESRERDFRVSIRLHRTARRSVLINDVKQKKISALSDVLRCVLFCPEDLSLVREGALVRRRFLDQSISQLRPKYQDALARYQRLLEHKTQILKASRDKPSLLEVLDEFNDGLCRTGALIIHYRAHFIRKLGAMAEEILQDFSGGREELQLQYQTVSTIEDPFAKPILLYEWLQAHMAQHSKAELASHSCLSGPHKDDLLSFLNGKNARQFASQGQCRSLALSFKLAERELHREDTGAFPVLLLDDVLSELDARRKSFVLERIQGGQVFISSCEQHPDLKHEAALFTIEDGALADKTLF